MSSPPEAIFAKSIENMFSRDIAANAAIMLWVSASSNKKQVVSFPFIPYNLCPINQAMGSPGGLETDLETYQKKNSGTWEVVIKKLTVMVGFREHGNLGNYLFYIISPGNMRVFL
jgi:hypothetical protein